MIKLLSMLGGWQGYAATGVAAATLTVVATLTIDSWRYGAKISDMVASHATVMQGYSDRAYHAETAQREEEQRRISERETISNEAKTKVAGAQADTARALGERDRVRGELATYITNHRKTRLDPDIGIGSADAAHPIDLLANLFSRADDRAGELSTYADTLRIAGETCNRQYESLTAGP